MVSNSLHMTEEDFVTSLTRIRDEAGSDPEYAGMRASLPADWPL